MSNVFIPLMADGENRAGPPREVFGLGAAKTVIISGAWDHPPTISLEINNAPYHASGSWHTVFHCTGASWDHLTVPARWLRAVVSNFKKGMAPQICVAADNAVAPRFIELSCPPCDGPSGAAMTDELGAAKLLQVGGTFSGVIHVEFSADGQGWATAHSFTGPGIRDVRFLAAYMRVRRSGVKRGAAGAAPECPVVIVAS